MIKLFKHHYLTLYTFLILGVMISLFLPQNNSPYKWDQFAQLPVLHGGRIKPIDTVARATLLSMQGKQTIRIKSKEIMPIEWLLQLSTNPKLTDTYPIFVIEHPYLFSFLGKEYHRQKYRVSFNFLKTHQDTITAHAKIAESKDATNRNFYEREVIRLNNRVMTYVQLKNSLTLESHPPLSMQIDHYTKILPQGLTALKTHESPQSKHKNTPELQHLNQFFKSFRLMDQWSYYYPVPSFDHGKDDMAWSSIGKGLLQHLTITDPLNPALLFYADILDAYDQQKHVQFNIVLDEYTALLQSQHSNLLKRTQIEAWFNQVQLFYLAMLLYAVSFLLILVAWITKKKPFQQMGFRTIQIGFCLHTVGLLLRMWLQGRPPVTNLYSSAIFVGWAAVLIGIIVERRQQLGIMGAISSIMGGLTLIIAHHLSFSGDTLDMMQAVLDSNFWLSTHVTCITLGYSGVFLAGLGAHIYILKGFLTKSLTKKEEKQLFSTVYGLACFALIFSFIGTVLGGIWADQSWGRFWGWDPKENGALLIVIWLAIMLHGRISGLKAQGFMVLAIFGNIVCSASWFGVNMLGIGLHSYGFMDHALAWLLTFWVIELGIMGIGLIPRSIWRSP